MTDELGKAELQLGADLAPLDADLKDAETRAALSVAKIQAMFDTLRMKVDAQVSAIDALAARAASGAPGAGTSSVTNMGSRNEIWGVRGPDHPGSLQNPLVTVVAAGKYFPMGSYAAAVGDDNATDTSGARADQSSGLATSAEIAALTSAIHDLASNATPGRMMAAAGSAGIGESGGQRVAVAIDDENTQALRDIAATLGRLEQRGSQAPGGGHTVIVDHSGAASSSSGPSRIFVGGPGGGSSQTFSGLRGEQTVRLDDAQYAGLISAMLKGGGGGGGGAGATYLNPEHRSVDVFYHADPATHAAADSTSLLAALGLGTGAFGKFAGVGSAASFAGFGFEHFLTTLLGVGGSAAGAVGGAGLLGLGALGAGGVGLGSDLGVSASAASDTKLLYTDYTNLTAAVQQYGKSSQQAAAAQSQLNFDIKDTLQGTAGVYAELGLAKQLDALNTKWDQTTSQARVLFAEIADQVVKLANVYMPEVIAAADRNLAIINTAIRPLFTWLEGPDGIQIWRDLENVFATDMPAGIAAFTQAVELIARVMDLASQDIGGFTAGLDRLFTRLNSESNATLDQEIQKLIGDFKLWEHFVVLLTEDIYGLFHQDVGTGNSIIAVLTEALQKLHDYEQSATGQGELTNIFMVHKTEVLDLIDVFGKLSAIFGHIYLAVAPALVTVMNDAVLPAMKAVADVVAFLAGKSQILATLMGLALITSKFGGVGAVPGVLGGATKFLTGGTAGAAAGATATGAAAEGAGGAVAIGGLPKLLGLLPGVSAESVAAAASAALPVLLAGGAAVTLIDVLSNAFPPNSAAHATAQGLTGVTTGSKATPSVAGRFGNVGVNTTSPSSQTLDVQEVGKFADYSSQRLAALIKEMKEYGNLQLNGTNVPKQQLIALADAALKAKDSFNKAFNEAWTAVNTFYRNTSTTLPALYDDFNTNMKLIAHTMGTNSEDGRKDVATNITQMVNAVTQGMLDGTISVSSGMHAIHQALQTGMQDNATTWKTDWQSMFTSVTALYQRHLIDTSQFLSSLDSMSKTALGQIKSETETSYQQTFNNLKQQYDDGLITKGQFDSKVHAANQTANAQERTDMNEWAGQVLTAMTAAGVSSNNGVQAIFKPLNAALTALGQKPLSLVSVGTSDVANAVSQGVSNLIGPLVPGHATGSKVTRPQYMVGEEAPTHPEYVLATNPAYRRKNLGLWAAAGRDLGIPGFASGGVYSYGQLEGLWDQAGGNPSMAALMAAIAEAESGGQTDAHNASGASGLWQILGVPFPGNVYDALTNARMAVAKLASQGLGAWTTYTSGAYKQYLHGNVPASAGGPAGGRGGAAVANINVPSVHGSGALATIVGKALAKVASVANNFLGGIAPSGGGGGGGGSVPLGPASGLFSPSQLGTYDGLQVADWIIPELAWARAHGWGGTVQSGYRSPTQVVHGVFATAPQGQSEHQYDIYPGGAVDVSDYQQFAQIIQGYPGADKLIQLGIDPLHFSGTGHATGGRIPGFAEGGIFGPGGPSLVGTAFATNAANAQDPIASAMGRISNLIGPDGAVSKLTDLMSYWQGMWALNSTVSNIASGGASAAIVTNSTTGAQSIDQADVNTAIAQLSQEVGWENTIVQDLQTALTLSQILPPKIRAQIKKYQDKIAAIKKRIQENIKQINALNKMINSEQGKKKPNYHAISTWKNQILGLETENVQLGGDKTAVGTGGQLGGLTGQVTTLQNDLQTVQGYPDTIGGAGGSGLGGELGPAKISLAQLSQELSALSPSALQTALTAAEAQASTSASTSNLDALLEQQNTLLAQQYEVSQAQYAVLAGPEFGLPPFGGSFANGGIVPGPPGAPRTVIAHGGEAIGQPGDVNIHAHGSAKALMDMIDWRIEQNGRTQARVARRQLPGRAGALLSS